MELDVRFRLHCKVGSRGGLCGMADENYIRGLTDIIKGKIEDAREQTRKENREADIVKVEAPKQWMELKAWLRESIGQINKGVESNTILCLEDDLNEITVRYLADSEPRDVTVTFLAFTGQIIAKGMLFPGASPDFESAFDPKVVGNKMHYIQDKPPNARKSLEDIGKEILDRAVKP
jgi:hypothetical protein